MPFVEIEGLSRSYDGGFSLRDVSVTMEKGEIFTLMGPSGSGKSSFLRNVCGLDTPDSGRIIVDGRDITGLPTVRRNVGLIFQDLAIFPHMNVYDNIAFGLRAQRKNPAETDERVQELAAMLGISDLLDRYPGQISGGQRQRIALARSVAPSPPLLLLDEPLSSLDMQLRSQVRSDIKSFARKIGLSMIYVTHDHSEGLYMADQVGLIFNGEISRVSSPEDIFRSPGSERAARFFGYNVASVGGRRIAFHPSELEIEGKSPDIVGKVISAGFEGEAIRLYISMEDGVPIQLKVPPGTPVGEVSPGDSIGIRIRRKVEIEES